MSVWNDSELTVIYNLTPLHYGVGQAASAVDLPIAREAGTGFPLLPASGLKGVARDFLGRQDDQGEALPSADLDRLFGPDLDAAEGAQQVRTGALTFTEGRLVAYPGRSLNRPFLHLTCPLILERLARDLRAVGVALDLVPAGWSALPESGRVLVSAKELTGAPLVIEDLVYEGDKADYSDDLASLAQRLAERLPEGEEATRSRLTSGLVVLPDADFAALVARTPVRARIKLTAGKTTDRWKGPDGEVESGNLWYEEYLPPDCLFVVVVGERRQRTRGGAEAADGGKGESRRALEVLRRHAHRLSVVQIGGNETVGYGLCWWSGWSTGGGT